MKQKKKITQPLIAITTQRACTIYNPYIYTYAPDIYYNSVYAFTVCTLPGKLSSYLFYRGKSNKISRAINKLDLEKTKIKTIYYRQHCLLVFFFLSIIENNFTFVFAISRYKWIRQKKKIHKIYIFYFSTKTPIFNTALEEFVFFKHID